MDLSTCLSMPVTSCSPTYFQRVDYLQVGIKQRAALLMRKPGRTLPHKKLSSNMLLSEKI